MRIKHVDLAQRSVFQAAREVRTKNSKTFTSWFFPVGEDVEAIIAEGIGYLTTKKHFGPNDPLFPTTKTALNETGPFAAAGLDRRHWTMRKWQARASS
jgi:hypothetical protein